MFLNLIFFMFANNLTIYDIANTLGCTTARASKKILGAEPLYVSDVVLLCNAFDKMKQYDLNELIRSDFEGMEIAVGKRGTFINLKEGEE